MSIKFERIPEGYRIYKDAALIGVLSTKQHHRGKDSDHPVAAADADTLKVGGVVWEPMKAESWSLHLTSPSLSVEDFKAIASGIPTEA